MKFNRRQIGQLGILGIGAAAMPRLAFGQSIGEVTLGLSVPLTGNQAQYGEDIKLGAELAVETINKSGMVPGATFKLAVEDSKGDPQEAANVAQKLASREDIAAVCGDFSSTACLAAAPIYQRAGIVMITPTASHPDITKTGNFIFRNTPIASSEAGAVVDWGTKDLGFKTIGIIGRNDDYGRAYGQIFRSLAEANGATVVGEEYINADTQDLKPVITGMRVRKPDCVFLALFQVEAALLFRQSKEMKFAPTFMSGAGLFNPQVITLAQDAADGLLMVSTYFPESDRQQVKDFVALYQAGHPGGVPSKFVAHAYDGISLLANAVKVAGNANRAAIRDSLAATKAFPGVTGDLSFDENREILLGLQRIAVENQKFVRWTKG